MPNIQERRSNRIWRMLDEAHLDWCASRRELTARSGTVTTWFGKSVILASTDPFFVGFAEPLQFNVELVSHPDLPPNDLYGSSAVSTTAKLDSATAEQHFWTVVEEVGRRLGSTPKDTSVSNTIERTWHDGPARLELTFFPLALSLKMQNDLHKAEPWRELATTIRVTTGFQLRASRAELDLFDDLQECALTSAKCPYQPVWSLASEGEYWRTLHRSRLGAVVSTLAGLLRGREVERGLVYLAADTTMVVVSGASSSAGRWLIVPTADIDYVELVDLTPARGPGGFQVSLVCRTGSRFEAGAPTTKSVLIASTARVDEMTEATHAFAKQIGKRCEVVTYADA
jgi:hypothetical protein